MASAARRQAGTTLPKLERIVPHPDVENAPDSGESAARGVRRWYGEIGIDRVHQLSADDHRIPVVSTLVCLISALERLAIALCNGVICHTMRGLGDHRIRIFREIVL
jgi:hypothetical protein